VNSLNGVALRARALATEEANMLWTIAIVLLALWALGLVSSFTMGGFIHPGSWPR
jgi:hypothetical protein